MKKYMLILILIFTSCASRKVNTSIAVEKKDITSTTNTEVKKIDIIEKVDSTKIDSKIEEQEIEFCPIDSTKEIVVDGKIYKNVHIRYKKKKSNTLYVNGNKESEIHSNDSTSNNKTVSVESKRKKVKLVVPQPPSYKFIIWWLLIILIIYLIWRNRIWLLAKL